MAPTQRTKFAAVAALAVGSVAAAAGTANAAQGGLATENAGGSPAPTKVSQTKTPSSLTKSAPKSGGQGGVTTETKKAPTGSPAPSTTSATVQKSAPSGGGQGGIATEAPAPTIAQAEAEQEQPKPAAPAPAAQSAPSAASAPSTSTQSAPARAQTAAYTETYTDTSKVTATPAATTTAQVTPVAYTQTTTATGQADNAPSTGQGGLVAEVPAEDSAAVKGKQPADTAPADTAPADTAPADTAPADTAPADTAPADYTERVETASQTPTSGSFTPASPAEPNGAVSTYTETRQGETAAVTGGEVGVVGADVATGTAVEVNDTTSYVSNTTVGGGEQATAAQTWDVSNGNYNATWATTGGVSGTGGFSATNEQTAPNVGTTTVDGQWTSADGASSVSVSGGATLENYGVHGAQGSVEITTPVGDFAFVF